MNLTDLDIKLLEIAANDPIKFVKMVGEDRWAAAKVCLLRQSGNTYGQIMNKVIVADKKITIQAVRTACRQCNV